MGKMSFFSFAAQLNASHMDLEQKKAQNFGPTVNLFGLKDVNEMRL